MPVPDPLPIGKDPDRFPAKGDRIHPVARRSFQRDSQRQNQTARYPSNWELSSARANTVLKLLLDLGFPPNRLASAGYGEFYPISKGEAESDLQQNRRIELKLTSR